jgi:hypothetical protein
MHPYMGVRMEVFMSCIYVYMRSLYVHCVYLFILFIHDLFTNSLFVVYSLTFVCILHCVSLLIASLNKLHTNHGLIPPWFCSGTIWKMTNRPVRGRSSQTYSRTIDIMVSLAAARNTARYTWLTVQLGDQELATERNA